MTPPVGGKASIGKAVVFGASAFLGGAVTGLFVFLFGSAVRASDAAFTFLTGVTLVAAALLASTTAIGKLIPTLGGSWIIPRRWGAYGSTTFAALFGFNMGLGWRTRIGSNLFWILMAGAALEDRLQFAVLPFMAFAATRALPILVTAAVRSTFKEHYRRELTLTDVELLRLMPRSRFGRLASVASAIALGVSVYSFTTAL